MQAYRGQSEESKSAFKKILRVRNRFLSRFEVLEEKKNVIFSKKTSCILQLKFFYYTY